MLQRIHFASEGVIKEFWSFGTTFWVDIDVTFAKLYARTFMHPKSQGCVKFHYIKQKLC